MTTSVNQPLKTGDNIDTSNANWKFKGSVVENFDNHILKSVPLYEEGHNLIVNLSDYFINDDSICYELGASTAALSIKLAKHNQTKTAKFIGIEKEEDMYKKALESTKNISNIEIFNDDILTFDFLKSDFIVSYYTIQFIKPSVRQDIFNKIYDSLNWGGAFILFEKVRANDARFQDITTGLYNDFKLNNGYTPDEIISKSRSLKGVLEPFSTQGNIDMLKRAGFKDIISIMKYISFEGFLVIK